MTNLLVYAIVLIVIGYLSYAYLPKPMGTIIGIVCAVILLVKLVGLI